MAAKALNRLWFTALLFSVLFIGFGLGILSTKPTPESLTPALRAEMLITRMEVQMLRNTLDSPIKPETCITGVFLINYLGGFVAVGDQKICGVGVHYDGAIHGPSEIPNPVR